MNDKPAISIVTWNRAALLEQALSLIHTTSPEPHDVYVTNNGSSDGTAEVLARAQRYGLVTEYWNLAENLGTAGGRNAHWHRCVGRPAIRFDDKVVPKARHWLTVLRLQSEAQHALVAAPYDPTVRVIEALAPPLPYMNWEHDEGQGGPLIYLPAEVTEALGYVDELTPDIRYGWDDCLYIKRAMLLGWRFGFTLRAPFEFGASASPAARQKALSYHGLYLERLRQYAEAERDLRIEREQTYGAAAGLAAQAAGA